MRSVMQESEQPDFWLSPRARTFEVCDRVAHVGSIRNPAPSHYRFPHLDNRLPTTRISPGHLPAVDPTLQTEQTRHAHPQSRNNGNR